MQSVYLHVSVSVIGHVLKVIRAIVMYLLSIGIYTVISEPNFQLNYTLRKKVSSMVLQNGQRFYMELLSEPGSEISKLYSVVRNHKRFFTRTFNGSSGRVPPITLSKGFYVEPLKVPA